MSTVLLTSSCTTNTAKAAAAAASLPIGFRYDYDDRRCCWNGDGKGKKSKLNPTLIGEHKKRTLSFSPKAKSAVATKRNSPQPNLNLEVLDAAREKFTQEISFQSKDKVISLAKALLYVAAEDEAFIAFHKEMDALSFQSERRDASVVSNTQEWDSLEKMPLAGKSINEWLTELDTIAKEVRAELVSRDIGCHLVEVLEAVNLVLFESRGFKRPRVLVDPKYSYLHSALSTGCGSAILLSVIYIEVCRRLNLTIVGSRVGEEFLIWPQMGNPEELFKVTSGHSLFGVVNGRCVDDPRSKASDLSGSSLSGLDIATNRDIIGIALANLIRLHWKSASRTNHGLMLTSPLRPVHDANDKFGNIDGSNVPLVRPWDLRFLQDWLEKGENCEIWTHDIVPIDSSFLTRLIRSLANHAVMLLLLSSIFDFQSADGFYSLSPPVNSAWRARHLTSAAADIPSNTASKLLWTPEKLAIMASERLLILQPHNWALRRDHGMMLYYSREYEAAVQELSICMAFAPEEEAGVLEPFVEKLHLLRLESSWKSRGVKVR